MENPILITWLNDFIFCPISIYFHNLYGETNRLSLQEPRQINGTAAHENIDTGKYSTRKSILSGISVYSDQYDLTGKIDLFDTVKGELVERKKKIKTVYDGYIFQLYAQCLCLREMGYFVRLLTLRSLDDNKRYPVPLPEKDPVMLEKFCSVLDQLKSFDMESYQQTNAQKCANCIYEPLCDNSLLVGGGNTC